MRIAMIGATGLIGRSLAARLAGAHELLLIGRRAAGVVQAGERTGAMADWPALLAGERVDVAISTLGTTWKQAGSWEEFRAVDVEAVLAFARAARAAGARQMLSVSSVGALHGARNNYLAMKGRLSVGSSRSGSSGSTLSAPACCAGTVATTGGSPSGSGSRSARWSTWCSGAGSTASPQSTRISWRRRWRRWPGRRVRGGTSTSTAN